LRLQFRFVAFFFALIGFVGWFRLLTPDWWAWR
jgi:hypothetical protein